MTSYFYISLQKVRKKLQDTNGSVRVVQPAKSSFYTKFLSVENTHYVLKSHFTTPAVLLQIESRPSLWMVYKQQ